MLLVFNTNISRMMSTMLKCAKIEITLFILANIIIIRKIILGNRWALFIDIILATASGYNSNSVLICLCQKKAKIISSCTMGDADAVSHRFAKKGRKENKKERKIGTDCLHLQIRSYSNNNNILVRTI